MEGGSPRPLRVVTALQELTLAERHLLRSLWQRGQIEVGTGLYVSGRKLVVRGFDPVNASARRIYLHDEDSQLTFALELDDLFA